MSEWEETIGILIEVIEDLGRRVEALERIARSHGPRPPLEPPDITKPVVLSFKEEQKIKELMKKKPEDLR